MTDPQARHTGQCLCGAVRYTIAAPITSVTACHCGQCRRQSGHFVAAGTVRRAAVAIDDTAATLRWFQSSARARRGFCSACGSALFFDDGSDEFSFNVGSLDQPTGLSLSAHIFVADKADYYDITDDLPKFDAYP